MPVVNALLSKAEKLLKANEPGLALPLLRRALEITPAEVTLAKMMRRNKVTQFATQHLKNQGNIIIEHNKPVSDSVYKEVSRQYGLPSKIEKTLTDADLLKTPKYKELGKGLFLGGGIVAGGTAVGVGIESITGFTRDLFQDRAFEEMIKLHPKLQLLDQDRVRLFFNSLWTFAPDMAKDPLVSGDAVYRAMQMDISGGYPMEAIKTVVEIQHKKSDIKGGSPFGRNITEFMTDAGAKQTIGLYGK